jgi:hypothetical protein
VVKNRFNGLVGRIHDEGLWFRTPSGILSYPEANRNSTAYPLHSPLEWLDTAGSAETINNGWISWATVCSIAETSLIKIEGFKTTNNTQTLVPSRVSLLELVVPNIAEDTFTASAYRNLMRTFPATGDWTDVANRAVQSMFRYACGPKTVLVDRSMLSKMTAKYALHSLNPHLIRTCLKEHMASLAGCDISILMDLAPEFVEQLLSDTSLAVMSRIIDRTKEVALFSEQINVPAHNATVLGLYKVPATRTVNWKSILASFGLLFLLAFFSRPSTMAITSGGLVTAIVKGSKYKKWRKSMFQLWMEASRRLDTLLAQLPGASDIMTALADAPSPIRDFAKRCSTWTPTQWLIAFQLVVAVPAIEECIKGSRPNVAFAYAIFEATFRCWPNKPPVPFVLQLVTLHMLFAHTGGFRGWLMHAAWNLYVIAYNGVPELNAPDDPTAALPTAGVITPVLKVAKWCFRHPVLATICAVASVSAFTGVYRALTERTPPPKPRASTARAAFRERFWGPELSSSNKPLLCQPQIPTESQDDSLVLIEDWDFKDGFPTQPRKLVPLYSPLVADDFDGQQISIDKAPRTSAAELLKTPTGLSIFGLLPARDDRPVYMALEFNTPGYVPGKSGANIDAVLFKRLLVKVPVPDNLSGWETVAAGPIQTYIVDTCLSSEVVFADSTLVPGFYKRLFPDEPTALPANVMVPMTLASYFAHERKTLEMLYIQHYAANSKSIHLMVYTTAELGPRQFPSTTPILPKGGEILYKRMAADSEGRRPVESVPRPIYNVHKRIQLAVGPYILGVSKVMKAHLWLTQRGIPIDFALRSSDPQHPHIHKRMFLYYGGSRSDLDLTLWMAHVRTHIGVHIIASGDDSLCVLNAPDYTLTYVEGDNSKHDRSVRRGALSTEYALYRRLGMPSAVVDSLEKMSRLPLVLDQKQGPGAHAPVSRVTVMREPHRDTGGPNTSCGNTINVLLAIGNYFLTGRKVQEIGDSISAAMADLGFSHKVRVDPAMPTFLKGSWLPYNDATESRPGQEPVHIWAPLPSRVIKASKMLSDPLVVFSDHLDAAMGPPVRKSLSDRIIRTHRATHCILVSQAQQLASYATPPLISAFVQRFNLDADLPYIQEDTAHRVIGTGTFRSHIPTADAYEIVCAHYGLSDVELEMAREQLLRANPGDFIAGPWWEKIMRVDYA